MAQTSNGLATDLSNRFRLSDAQTRSTSPDNFIGAQSQGSYATESTGKNAQRVFDALRGYMQVK